MTRRATHGHQHHRQQQPQQHTQRVWVTTTTRRVIHRARHQTHTRIRGRGTESIQYTDSDRTAGRKLPPGGWWENLGASGGHRSANPILCL